MFNVKHPSAGAAALWTSRLSQRCGLEVDDEALTALDRYATWLATEAAPAGAIGPDEVERLWPRHLADSLAYAAGFNHRQGRALDIGSGAGLPGIPLAIVRPGLQMTLLDRSGRRTALLRRVVRILGLPNVRVVEADVDTIRTSYDVVVARASLPPERAFCRIGRLLSADGEAVVGVSRHASPDAAGLEAAAARHGLHAELVTVPAEMLDSPAWLLRMTHRDHHS
jgi:16S rRNA (guanine527-N7)-methyltransferase